MRLTWIGYNRSTATFRWHVDTVHEYYEPWSSAFNFAFFQTAEFHPKTLSSWDVAIVPIENGLDSAETSELRRAIEAHLTKLDIILEGKVVKNV